MKLIWLTDIHLNFIDENERIIFYQKIVMENGDAILITGDIAEAISIENLLKEMARYIQKPIYFVLGNHDYYRGNVDSVRQSMTLLSQTEPFLHWLPATGIQQLNSQTILLGQDGWADGRLGDYQKSKISIHDSRMIADLFQKKLLGKLPLLEKMQQLADLDAEQLKNNLTQAIHQKPKKIIILTHIPPFKEACLYEGKISDDNWLPYFGSQVMGDVLMEIANKNIDVEFLVLCGHTHSEAYYQPLKNLMIKVGVAEYYYPDIREVMVVL